MAIKDDMEDVQEAVINELITENGITNTLADDQVTETKILNNAVTTNKIDNGAVTSAKLSQAYLPLTGGTVSGNNDFGLQTNRTGTNGKLINFRKDGLDVGAISYTGNMEFNAAGYAISLRPNDGADGSTNTVWSQANIKPWLPNYYDLGSATYRWDDIYATNGTIQTSDRNEKQDIEELSEAEQRVAVACKGLLRKFRWKSAVEDKGDEARIHFGIIAQDLQAAFEAEGLDAGRYAMFISSTWTDEETGEEKTRRGIRYSELLAFIISAI